MPIMTLGHSTHTIEQFVRIAKAARLDAIVDVRSHRSSKWEQWHGEKMDVWLPAHDLASCSTPALGGWDVRHAGLMNWATDRGVDLAPYVKGHFPKQRIGRKTEDQGHLDPAFRSSWTNQGLHDYSWYTALEEFQTALTRLADTFGGNTQPRCAIVCAELPWWKCHRSMIADVLAFRGYPVFHLMPKTDQVKYERHDATERIERYPTAVRRAWLDAPI